LPTQQKIDRVEDITDRLKRSSIAMTTRYSGISVNEMTELRRAMRNGGVDFTIVKNTLLALAAEGAEKPQLKEIVDGPTAIAFGYDDPVDAAKVIADYIRSGRSSLAIMGAVMGDGAPMSADEVTRLASLPPRAQLLASLLGLMQAPIAQLLTIMNGPVQALDNVLQARVRQMEEEAPAPEAPVEAAAEPEAPAAEASTDDEPAAEADEAPAAEASTDDEPTAEADEASEPEADARDATADEPEAEKEGDSE
jgi:large subunit ribosomal protein L10